MVQIRSLTRGWVIDRGRTAVLRVIVNHHHVAANILPLAGEPATVIHDVGKVLIKRRLVFWRNLHFLRRKIGKRACVIRVKRLKVAVVLRVTEIAGETFVNSIWREQRSVYINNLVATQNCRIKPISSLSAHVFEIKVFKIVVATNRIAFAAKGQAVNVTAAAFKVKSIKSSQIIK